jgi:acyl-coenzyme A synthetase/AMP-(fatty) acid ligase
MEKVNKKFHFLKVAWMQHDRHSFCTGVIAFLILKDGVVVEQEEIVQSLKDLVRKKIAAFAIPTAFVVCF